MMGAAQSWTFTARKTLRKPSLRRQRRNLERYDRLLVPDPKLLPVGELLVLDPGQVPVVEEEPARVPYRKADALRTLAEVNPDAEALVKALRYFPAKVLAHPALALLMLTEPETGVHLRRKAEGRIASLAWKTVRKRLSLDDYRRLVIATLLRAAPVLDRELGCGLPGEEPCRRVAGWLAAVMDKQVSRSLARQLLRRGICGAPPPSIVVTCNEARLERSRHALRTLTAAVVLVIGPPRGVEPTDEPRCLPRRALKRRARYDKGGRASSAGYQPLDALDRLTDVLLDKQDACRTAHTRWLTQSARALLRGKSISTSP